ncbi:MAG: Calx-beta domain-containing protein, partial [Microcystis panniformis]
MTSTLLPIFPTVYDVLFDFAQSDGFWANLETAFGTSYDVVKATQLRQQWQSRDFSQLPPITVQNLGNSGIFGAYSSSINKIYISQALIDSGDATTLSAVLLEEIGHFIDAKLNSSDTPGDEGQLFSALVRGEIPAVSTVTASYTDNGGTEESITSSATASVAAAPVSAPALVASTPSDGNGAVSVAADITLVFNEAVKGGSGTITIKDGSGIAVKTIAITDATQVRFDGSKVIINPNGDLAALSNYSVQIANGAITNLAGAAYAGISDTTSLNFTTGRILYATTERGNTNTTGAGTSANPYKSLGYASQIAQAGDTIYLTATNSSGSALSGSEAIANSYTIRSNGTAASPIVIKPNPAASDRYVFTSANGLIVTGSHTVIEGFEFYGKTDGVDYWSLVAKSWGFGGGIDDSIYPVGDIAINVTTGTNILIKNNYFHDLVQKAVNIEGGRYVTVQNNVIQNVGTTSLSGGHGIMRQQGSYSNFGTPDQAGLYRWDITGNLIFNVEQRIYSWVPSKGYLNMTLDEGKPINIDETTDTQMQARISQNIIGYANIDSIRLKPTANLEVSYNSIYSDGPHADGITDTNTLGITTPFPGINVTGNLVQTAAGTFGFELNDGFNSSGSNFSSSGNVMFGGTASNTTFFTGVSTASGALFANPEQGDFTPTTAAGNAGASAATRTSLAALVASQGVTVADDNWSVDERKLVQTLLDNIPGIRDGITNNETIFKETGILYANSLKEPGRKAYYFAIDPTWKTANGVSDASLDRPGTTYDGLYELVVPLDYSTWLDAALAIYKQWDGSAFNGAPYSSARYGDSYIEQNKVFDTTGLSIFQLRGDSNYDQTTALGKSVTLGGDILIDLENYTPTGGPHTYDLVKAGNIIGNFAHVRVEGLTINTNYDLSIVGGNTLRLTLNDDVQPPISLSINDVTVTEGNSGTTNAVFTVSLSSAASTVVSVNYATANGTATAGTDYTAIPPTTLTFNPGETSKTITVAVNGDNQVELNETFFLNLSNLQANGSNVTLADNQGQGTINNNDSASIAITDVTVTEGNSGTTNAVFTVTLSNPIDTAITLNYATANGTATTADNDYIAIATTSLTFNAGETSKAITVAVNGDTKVESNETFFINLSNLNANGRNVTITDTQGQGTINNDDIAPPKITIAPGTNPVEGGTVGTFIITLDTPAPTGGIVVNFNTTGSTATILADYSLTAGTNISAVTANTFTIAAGATTATLNVVALSDAVNDPNETVKVNLTSGGDYILTSFNPATNFSVG